MNSPVAGWDLDAGKEAKREKKRRGTQGCSFRQKKKDKDYYWWPWILLGRKWRSDYKHVLWNEHQPMQTLPWLHCPNWTFLGCILHLSNLSPLSFGLLDSKLDMLTMDWTSSIESRNPTNYSSQTLLVSLNILSYNHQNYKLWPNKAIVFTQSCGPQGRHRAQALPCWLQ